MKTVRNLCIEALQECGALSDVDPVAQRDLDLAYSKYQTALSLLNQFADFPCYPMAVDATLSNGVGECSVGPTLDFDVSPTPQRVKSLKFLIGTAWVNCEQLGFVDLQKYQEIENLNTYPSFFSYRLDDENQGLINVYPQPNGTLQARIVVEKQLETLGLNDVILLPNGYYDALMYEMARLLCGPYGIVEKFGFIQMEAKKRIDQLRKLNHRTRRMDNDAVLGGGGKYDIRSDTVVGGFNV
jgi:hypothetical protein